MNMEFVESQKGKKFLCHEGYTYEKEKDGSSGRTIWRCTEKRRNKCPARKHTNFDSIIKSLGEHNHVPNQAQIEAKTALNGIKKTAVSTRDPPCVVVGESSKNLNVAAQVAIPSCSSLKRTVRRIRNKKGNFPPVPTKLCDLRIPADTKLITINGQQESFLIYDSDETSSNRILIFSTQNNLNLLSRCLHWYVDGTFKTAPPLFSQLYTIHGVQYNRTFPLIFALLPNKTRKTYDELIDVILTLSPEALSPRSIMMDFEKAAISAFTSKFADSQLRGCFFHLSQCVWRKIQDSGRSGRYASDPVFALQIKMIPATAFLPPEDVTDAFDQLVESDYYRENAEDLQPITDYFEDTWVGRLGRRERRAPQYAISMWNSYHAVEDDLPRTNNCVEGWHRKFSASIYSQHPSIWKFIECLKTEQTSNSILIEQCIAGNNPPQQKKSTEI